MEEEQLWFRYEILLAAVDIHLLNEGFLYWTLYQMAEGGERLSLIDTGSWITYASSIILA